MQSFTKGIILHPTKLPTVVQHNAIIWPAASPLHAMTIYAISATQWFVPSKMKAATHIVVIQGADTKYWTAMYIKIPHITPRHIFYKEVLPTLLLIMSAAASYIEGDIPEPYIIKAPKTQPLKLKIQMHHKSNRLICLL